MEGDTITLQDIFVFERKGKDENGKIIGEFKPTGIRPKAYDQLVAAGVDLTNVSFSRGVA